MLTITPWDLLLDPGTTGPTETTRCHRAGGAERGSADATRDSAAATWTGQRQRQHPRGGLFVASGLSVKLDWASSGVDWINLSGKMGRKSWTARSHLELTIPQTDAKNEDHDEDEIRTHAGRAHWISSPTP